MPRDISAIATHLALEQALKTFLIVSVDWGGVTGIKLYADHIPLNHLNVLRTDVDAKLHSISDPSITESSKAFAEIQSVSISISDTSGALRTEMETTVFEGRDIKVLQAFEGIEPDKEPVLFEGKVEGPVTWDEGERLISFDAVTYFRDIEMPGVLDDATLAAIPYSGVSNLDTDNLKNRFAPLGFGGVVNSPALRLTKQFEALSSSKLVIHHDIVDQTDEDITPDSTFIDVRSLNAADPPFKGITLASITHFEINDIIIAVSHTTGAPTGQERFTITDNNLKKYASKLLTGDDSFLTAERPEADIDEENPKVLWLAEEGFIIQKNTMRLHTPTNINMWNDCIRQEGRKCFFSEAWSSRETVSSIGGGTIIRRTNELIEEGRQLDEIRVFKPDASFPTEDDFRTKDSLVINEGALIRVWDTSIEYGYQPEIYFVNNAGALISSVKSNVSRLGQLAEVPFKTQPAKESYYSITTNWQSLGPTILNLPIPLSFYPNLGWSDQIFASFRSATGEANIDGTTLPTDPWGNTAAIIDFLIRTYSEEFYVPDPTTFASVATDVASFPAGFVILEPTNLFSLLTEIAWQSRCFLTLIGNTVFIKYVSKTPVAFDLTVDDNNALMQSVKLTWQETNDLTTIVTYLVRTSYDLDLQEFHIRENVDVAGEHEATWSFFIYNSTVCAQKSADFWLHRKAQLWRRFIVTLPLEALALSLYDIVEIDLSGILGNFTNITIASITTEVRQLNYSTQNKAINTILEVNIALGEDTTQDGTYYTVGAISPRPENPAAIDQKTYEPLFFEEVVTEHKIEVHKDVSVHRRINRFGEVTSAGPATIRNRDLLMHRLTDKEWVLINIIDLLDVEDVDSIGTVVNLAGIYSV